MHKTEYITLLELNQAISLELNKSFTDAYWIVCEINELKVNSSRHCYLELIEKDKNTEAIVAKSRATIWARTYNKLLPYFETSTQHAFCEGIKVMIKASVEFHELYGLSLNIIDIDPAYTLGDLKQQKQEAIAKLKTEGVFFMNKELILPSPIQKIAVISSATAAGYGDFTNQINNNTYNYKFYFKLFPAMMQGDNAENSIIEALEKVYEYEYFFDAVVIIRGGGSKTDLSCFDKYWLAYHVAQFPLPIITGIGHEQDDTVTDMVAHIKLKTPTAVASFLIESLVDFEEKLDENFYLLKDFISNLVYKEKQNLYKLSGNTLNITRQLLSGKKEQIHILKNNMIAVLKTYIHQSYLIHKKLLFSIKNIAFSKLKIKTHILNQLHTDIIKVVKFYFKNNNLLLEHSKKITEAFDPQNVINRGYSITTFNGRVVKDIKTVSIGDEIQTRIKNGKLKSTITNKK